MQAVSVKKVVSTNQSYNKHQHCFSCGRPLEPHRQRYCSKNCKQEFVFKLNWFNNLFKVLQVRQATFTFTEHVLILNILIFNQKEVFTFFYTRTSGAKPAMDIGKMVFRLGEIWWDGKNETRSMYKARKNLLAQGKTQVFGEEVIKVRQIHYPANVEKALSFLRLNIKDVKDISNAELKIKQAYKAAALNCHPDLGGNSENFLRLQRYYQDLLDWLEKPNYGLRRGVPLQWSYNSKSSNWLTPL